jgi:hypothetical protein
VLHHSGKGVFDGVALGHPPDGLTASGSLTRPSRAAYGDWFKAQVDSSFIGYEVGAKGGGRSVLDKGTPEWERYMQGKAPAPFRWESSCYDCRVIG